MAYIEHGRLSALALLSKLRRTLAQFPQAVVHSHGYKPDILLAALRIPRRLGCIATCHTWYSDTLKMKLAERLDKQVLRGFDSVVAVSDEIHADLAANGVPSGKISRIDNGIEVPSLDPDAGASLRREFAVAPGEPLIVQVGRLSRSKRNDLLLQAVARLPEPRLARVLLVGEGDQQSLLAEQARSLGLFECVTFCGYRTDVHRFLAAADVLVLSSNKEGLPIILLEAMAIGCPIVSTAVGAVPTVLRADENAWVVPVDDAASLSRAIEQALTDRPLARQRADRAKSNFRARFSREVMGRRYLDLYDRIYHRRGWA